MKSPIFTLILAYCLSSPVEGDRRTAPRRTTLPGGTYGTETVATEPPTMPSVEETSPSSEGAALPQIAPASVIPAGFPVASMNPVPAGSGGVISMGVPMAGGVVPMGVPIAPGILQIPGALQMPAIQQSSFQKRPAQAPAGPLTTTEKSEENQQDLDGAANTPKDRTPVVGLCEEEESILPPGTTQEECFTGEPITLRYWQPYRALRNIKCKNA